MEGVSLAAFWVSVARCVLATAMAWAPLIPGLFRPRQALAVASAGTWSNPGPLTRAGEVSPSFGSRLVPSWLTLASLAVCLVARGVAAGRPPLTDLWEFTVAFAAAVSVF